MAFRHIVVPTDFSEPANHALSYAVEEAILHGAKVTLLHVQPVDARTGVYYVTGAPSSGLEAGFDVVAGGRLAMAPVSDPTVVRQDYSDEALTRLRDLVPEAYRDRARRAPDSRRHRSRSDAPPTRSSALPESGRPILSSWRLMAAPDWSTWSWVALPKRWCAWLRVQY